MLILNILITLRREYFFMLFGYKIEEERKGEKGKANKCHLKMRRMYIEEMCEDDDDDDLINK